MAKNKNKKEYFNEYNKLTDYGEKMITLYSILGFIVLIILVVLGTIFVPIIIFGLAMLAIGGAAILLIVSFGSLIGSLVCQVVESRMAKKARDKRYAEEYKKQQEREKDVL